MIVAPATLLANDPDLLRWVHDAFTEAFLGAHELCGGPIPGGPDAYVREWAQAGRLMGVADPPTTRAALHAETSEYFREAKVDERVVEAVRFVRRPRLPGITGRVYPILFGGAVASLAPEYRTLLGCVGRGGPPSPSRGSRSPSARTPSVRRLRANGTPALASLDSRRVQ